MTEMTRLSAIDRLSNGIVIKRSHSHHEAPSTAAES